MYLNGSDVLGADYPTASGAGPFVTIHVKDVQSTVKAKAGSTGALAAKLAPSTIEAKVYNDMRDKISAKMAEEGVDADVKVVSMVPPGVKLSGELFLGMGVGAGLLAMLYGAVKIAKHLVRK